MRKINKLAVLLLVIALAAVFTACQGAADEDKDTAEAQAAKAVTASQQDTDKVIKEKADESEKPQKSEKQQKQQSEAVKTSSAASSQSEVVEKQKSSSQKKSNAGSSKSKDQTSSKPKEPAKTETPKHTHKWEPVYATRQVEKTREVAWTKCYCCGADMTGHPEHIDQHLANHENNVHYGTEYRIETYYETEKYVSGYKCSCGARK